MCKFKFKCKSKCRFNFKYRSKSKITTVLYIHSVFYTPINTVILNNTITGNLSDEIEDSFSMQNSRWEMNASFGSFEIHDVKT